MSEAPSQPWVAGSATGVGSLPGTDVREAVRTVLGELPDLPHLPELPARGPGADLVGRGAGMLVDLHVDLQPAGWRLVDRPGRDERRSRALLREDLDALEEHAQGYRGPLKVQACGPWTLAAGVDLPRGDKVLSDAGALRDLRDSLAEGLAGHVAEVRRRVPGATVLLQLDEPSLAAVVRGAVRTASGLSALPAVEGTDVVAALRAVVQAVEVPVVVHSCAAEVPVTVLARAGVAALSLDARLLRLGEPSPYDEPLGEALESGVALWAGCVPALGSGDLSDPAVTVAPVRSLWRRLGLAPSRLGEQVVVTPTCGLAGAAPDRARTVMAAARAGARVLVDDPEG